jgi:peptidyl-dipeptidase Dcp
MTTAVTQPGAAGRKAGAPAPAALTSAAANPLFAPWTGPFGGVPPLASVRPVHLAPALRAGMEQQLDEIAAIANDPAAPTFENTIAALERTGRLLDRAQAVYGIFVSTLNDDEVQAVEREMAPELASFRDRITQNEKLFARIAAVYERRDADGLTPEQRRLVWLRYTTFVRAGARLGARSKKRLSAINRELASLYTRFSQNLLADEHDRYLLLEHPDELAGLPASVRDGAAADAEARGFAGKWLIANTRSSVEPFLTYSSRRDLRERVWRYFVGRGGFAGERDNNAITAAILRLRIERARLLGYATHAHWRLEDTMARTPDAAMALMEAVWEPAVARVREEVADMQAIADREAEASPGSPRFAIEPWDYRYYSEKVRAAKYDLDTHEIKPYLQLERLREGMFHVAGELFGLRFEPVADDGVPVHHADVRVWSVLAADGRALGAWYFDPFARKGKQSGAWMDQYRSQEKFDGPVPTLVSNNANFVKGRSGEPVLISWDDATVLFHEFGHALHGLLSDVQYPTLSGTNVARDYVEFPSQLLEHWLSVPQVLDRFARHHATNEPIPPDLVAKIDRARRFNQGFATVEYLASALIDMRLHLAAEPPADPVAFERETLAELGMPPQIVMRHRTPHFGHVFSSDGYSAGYYSYLWADTLTADAWEAFANAPCGAMDRDVAQRLHRHVFSAGNTVEPADAYRAFRGREAGIDALMRKRGFPAGTVAGAGPAVEPAPLPVRPAVPPERAPR